MLNFEPWKIAVVVVVTLAGVLFASPNFLGRESAESLPGWLPSKQINLGLDLQGGSHLLLEVDVGAVLAEELETLVDEKYLRKIPMDPMTGTADWDIEQCEGEDAQLGELQDELGGGLGGPGVWDVHSNSTVTALDGTRYSDW